MIQRLELKVKKAKTGIFVFENGDEKEKLAGTG
jgi:hypothetical protein